MTLSVVGKADDGTDIAQIKLARDGLSVSLLSFGATLQDLRLDTHPFSLVLGYPNAADYLQNPNYFGSTVGRFANRLCQGQFHIDGVAYQADINTPTGHHLHGGAKGTSHLNWTVTEHSEHHAVFEIILPDGHMGFPGNLRVQTQYNLLANRSLRIQISAQTDAPTLCSFAHHSYFNLTGKADISDHLLQISTQNYVSIDQEGIPLGAVQDVANTCLDFTIAKFLAPESIIDHNFCLSGARQVIRPVASLCAKDISMRIATTEPGLQVYTSEHIRSNGPIGHNGCYEPRAGIAMEPQIWPDAPNHKTFPSALLEPDQNYLQVSIFSFDYPV